MEDIIGHDIWKSPRLMSNNYSMLSQMPINSIFTGETLETVPPKPGITNKRILLFNTVLKFLANTFGKLETGNTLYCTTPKNIIHIGLCE